MNVMREAERPITDRPVRIGVEAYTSPEYARAEDERLWGKVWQIACREEEIPKVGDYVTYDIMDESIIVARVAEDRIAAYYNVCLHRGRRLTEGCGHTKKFVCKFHGWKWNLQGENVDCLMREEWEGALTDENLRMQQVQVDTWGGWVFINMDPEAGPLREWLGHAADMLDPFELGKMRYRWRQWLKFPCNWKVAMEAFVEGYHVPGTHPQLTKYGAKSTWSEAHGPHSVFGPAAKKGFGGASGGISADDIDMRVALAETIAQLWEEVNATTTKTIVDAAQRLVDELPEDTPAQQVSAHMMMSAMKDDAERGVEWPKIPPEHFAKAGTVWHLFPNSVIIQGPTFALCYRARPDGANPNSCIFEVYVIERFPEGEEPKPENVYVDQEQEERWRKVLCQDFANMEAVQQGIKSRGFPGARPNPFQERGVTNFHRMLAEYMGTGAPEPIA
ncbi:aromatic ring-hydroxylating oxygenase subunit alpha [Stakelama tenebrarum]|uniref:Aromatic ring-hydroxylating dioxygenase subunit alpha n=1 Tax=Stakelama tenebrarum TaxID=2711215 RepID=A0A6G6Y813_9SPHN|nr:aromatic ring-hydroxylating dioxygenase subunit alpha [Sphingosinithalassobacter tenebrarum]QIG80713.1 aromatic ring-hydroxylating dioxygenase subunit alpha [Sphingosinithalassobacter tenebrarum]